METQAVEHDGRTYSFGPYYSRNHHEHWSSVWTRAVVRAKRGADREIEEFGRTIALFVDGWLADTREYVITYVPARRSAVMFLFPEMGKCASRRVAEAIFRHLRWRPGVSLKRLLVTHGGKERRQRHCRGAKARRRNVCGHYEIADGVRVQGQNVVVVDDIVTSGATIEECSRVLRAAGAKSVTGLTLARTVHKPWWPQARTATA